VYNCLHGEELFCVIQYITVTQLYLCSRSAGLLDVLLHGKEDSRLHEGLAECLVLTAERNAVESEPN
jgi:hypothetical protein